MNPLASVDDLTPQHWAHANRLLVGKALAEFTHERLLTPEPAAAGAGRPETETRWYVVSMV